jgi:hypothetical protein
MCRQRFTYCRARCTVPTGSTTRCMAGLEESGRRAVVVGQARPRTGARSYAKEIRMIRIAVVIGSPARAAGPRSRRDGSPMSLRRFRPSRRARRPSRWWTWGTTVCRCSTSPSRRCSATTATRTPRGGRRRSDPSTAAIGTVGRPDARVHVSPDARVARCRSDARMSSAVLVHANGVGSLVHPWAQDRMAASRFSTHL